MVKGWASLRVEPGRERDVEDGLKEVQEIARKASSGSGKQVRSISVFLSVLFSIFILSHGSLLETGRKGGRRSGATRGQCDREPTDGPDGGRVG